MTALRRSGLPLGYLLLAVLVAVGIGVGIVRLISGLGATTALNDTYPWGLWIIYDVFFVPFSAGAFMILAVAHIYNRREYHAIARPVVLAGFLGEIMVVAVLVMDLGRWHQFYNVLFPWYWNVNSFMFQVSLCLTVYMGVMVLELAPVLLERLNWHRPLRLIKGLTAVIAIVGCVLSALHQSALGSLFLLMPYRLHPLWWSPLLPLLFFASAAFSGLSMAILVTVISFQAFRRPLHTRLLSELARVASAILGVYLAIRLADLIAAGEWELLFSEGWLSALFWAEILVGVLVPMVLFGTRRARETRRGLVWGSICVLLGLLLNRVNVSLLAQSVPDGATYVPHWMELLISAAAIAAGILLFALAVRFLPILPGDSRSNIAGFSNRTLILTGAAMCLITLLVILTLQPIAQAEASRIQAEPTSIPVESPREGTCQTCHQDPEALVKAGAHGESLAQLTIESQPADTPHGRIKCVTCHYGNETTVDTADAHLGAVTDPTQDGADLCLACHPDLPQEFPEDRLRTPHDEIAHGEAVDVSCSDCHGAVGHGFDPVSGEIICPMSVCLECHQTRALDHELTDCDACHIGPHAPVPALECDGCHQSTAVWKGVEMPTHPIELVGRHAQAQCSGCHEGPNFAQKVGTACAECHQPPDEAHYGPACETCHAPAGFQEVQLTDHPVALAGAHQNAPCAGCHLDQKSPSTVCADCHEPPQDHLSGECKICHTPAGWAQSAAFIVDLASELPHDLEGKENCLMCHDPAVKIKPAPSNHEDYINEQCVLCHKAEP